MDQVKLVWYIFLKTFLRSDMVQESTKYELTCNFSEKGQKKGKKGQNIWKFGQKRTKFENILKKDSLVRVIIVRMKQLEYALVSHARHA